jgi:hypothetical protein
MQVDAPDTNPQTDVTKQPEQHKKRVKRRSSSISRHKQTKTHDKFCKLVPKELTNQERLVALLSIICEHQKTAYYSKDQLHQDAYNTIYGNFLENSVPRILSRYEQQTVVVPNEKNRTNEARLKMLKYMRAKLQQEEEQWKRVHAELERNTKEFSEALVAPTLEQNLIEDESPETDVTLQKIQAQGSDLKDMMKNVMVSNVLIADQFALCTEQVAQLRRQAEKQQNELNKRVVKETLTVDELQRQKQDKFLALAGLTEDNELDFLKQLGPCPPLL